MTVFPVPEAPVNPRLHKYEKSYTISVKALKKRAVFHIIILYADTFCGGTVFFHARRLYPHENVFGTAWRMTLRIMTRLDCRGGTQG